jgi:Protein tyrosine/serine phosphatase
MSFFTKTIYPMDLPAAEREAYRHIDFRGTCNFRDLGGYHNAEGRAVAWGRLYRSDALHKLTGGDLKSLERAGLCCDIDFRADFEREENPDRLPRQDGIRQVALPIFDANSHMEQEVKDHIRTGQLDGIDPDELLKDAYAQFVSRFTPQFRGFISEVVAAEGRPILFHCTAGKDRTGFAAALILRILGVPQQAVLRDYMLSQFYWQKSMRNLLLFVRLTRGPRAMRLVQQLSSAKEDYLLTAFAKVDELYGSFDNYVHEGLGLHSSEIALLRAHLLEA